MKTLSFALALLFAVSVHARPCDSWFYANPSGKGIIRVRAVDEKLDFAKLKETVAGLNPAEWNGLANRLQSKLGNHYEVRVFTAEQFEQSGHDCNQSD